MTYVKPSSLRRYIMILLMFLIGLVIGGSISYIIVQPTINSLKSEIKEKNREIMDIKNKLILTEKELADVSSKLEDSLKKLNEASNKISLLEEELSSVRSELMDVLKCTCRIEVNASSPCIANGIDICEVYIKAYNVRGQPIDNARIAVIAYMANIRDDIHIVYSGFAEFIGNGTYYASFTSTIAGSLKILVVDIDSNVKACTNVKFLAGKLVKFLFNLKYYLNETGNLTSIGINIFPIDEFGNICYTTDLSVIVNDMSVTPLINEYGLPFVIIPYDPEFPLIKISVTDRITNVRVDEFLKVRFNASKPVHVVDLVIWIVDGIGVNRTHIDRDIDRANEIYRKNADECDFTKIIQFRIKEIRNISRDEWRRIAGADGCLDAGLISEVNNLPDDDNASTINVYYVPRIDYNYRDPKTGRMITVNALGVSWEGDKPGIAIDNSLDFDNRTLAHELAHQLSNNRVVDQGKPNANVQGANTPGNLMNYDFTGDDLTRVQAQLIEAEMGDP